MSTINILLVEDDPNLGDLVAEFLELKGDYLVTLCRDGQEGLDAFKKGTFHICILDIMMPIKDGFTLGKEIRSLNNDIPIIYASAKTLIEDKTTAFGIGADDYISKPFSIEEILLRIQAVLRRAQPSGSETSVFSIGDFTFDYPAKQLSRGGLMTKLSTKESELLRLLCLYKNKIMPREEALIKIWKEDNYFNGRSMDVYITKLRKILTQDARIEISNIHGTGCRLIAP